MAVKKFKKIMAANRGEIAVSRVYDDATRPGDSTQQLVELPRYRVEVPVDIGMIVFEVIQYHRTRPVVNKLGAFVEERGIVLVRFDNEIL